VSHDVVVVVTVEGDVAASAGEQEAFARATATHTAAGLQPGGAGTRQAQPVRTILSGGKKICFIILINM
jgi:hypothetical protein